MTNHCCFHYRFHPVGQGLFADGSLRVQPNHEFALRWVYDCGSISEGALVEDALTRLRADAPGRRLDLVVLSHFDNDHISGVARLLGQCSVDMLLLPYLPLWKRLIIAFEQNLSATADEMRFYVNPVEYLASIEGADIRRVVLVLPSGDTGPDVPGGDPNGRGDHPPDAPLEFDAGKPDEFGEANQLATAGRAAGVRVEFLRHGGAIRKPSLWEFVPYNDAKPAVFDKAFLDGAAELRDKLLAGASDTERTGRLKKLKKHYEAVRKPGEERNDISLFMYAGPIYRSWRKATLLCRWRSPRTLLGVLAGYLRGRRYITSPRCSIFYPGDGFLDTSTRLHKLAGYLKAERLSRIGVFQVMHHGAQLNWHAGVAARFSPTVSVFSSDPDRKPHLHPHKPVVQDFLGYGPARVDKVAGLELLGRLRR